MKIRNLLLMGSLALTSGCTSKYYKPELAESFAKISFANLTEQVPQLKVIDSCVASQIDNAIVERRNPKSTSKFSLKIPVQRKITFEYNSIWFGKDSTELLAQGTSLTNTTMVSTRKTAETCKKNITFIPEEGKHYELFFGRGKEKCVLGVSEVRINHETNEKQLYDVEAVSKQDC